MGNNRNPNHLNQHRTVGIMNIKELREDIKKMTLDEVCEKYNLTFKEIVEYTSKHRPRKKRKVYKRCEQPEEQYISCYHGKYHIRKTINGTLKHFGTYETLEDAIIMRDYLMKNGWYTARVKAIRRRLGV